MMVVITPDRARGLTAFASPGSLLFQVSDYVLARILKRKVLHLSLAVGFCFMFIMIAVQSVGTPQNIHVTGDKVYIDDANLYASAEPHTIYRSGWVYFNLTTKSYTGDIDVVWGFDTSKITPAAAELYSPHTSNVIRSHSCIGDYYNYTYGGLGSPDNHLWCWGKVTDYINDANGTGWEYRLMSDTWFEWGNLAEQTVYWNEQVFEDYIDISDKFDSIEYDFIGMTKWWYLQDILVQAGTNYQVRVYVDVPFNGAGKYSFGFKPSSESIHEAVQNSHLYLLDPWYDSYNYRYPIDFTPDSVSELPYSVNDSFGLKGDYFWARLSGDGNYTYSSLSGPDGSIAFGTAGAQADWENDTDRTGNGNENMWADLGAGAAWHMNNNAGTVYDSSPNSEDCTVTEAVTVSGIYGNALSFDGTNDKLDCGAGFKTIVAAYTLDAWIMVDNIADDCRIFTDLTTATTNGGRQLVMDGSDYWYYGAYNGAAQEASKAGDKIAFANTWHHAVAMQNATGMFLYVNATFIAKDVDGGTTGVTDVNMWIGARQRGALFGNCTIEEARFWNISLTETQIADIYNNGDPDSRTVLGAQEEFGAESGPSYSNNRTSNAQPVTYAPGLNHGFEIQWDATGGYFNTSNVSFISNFTGPNLRWENDNATSYVRNDTANVFYINFTQGQFAAPGLYNFSWVATNGTTNTTISYNYNLTNATATCTVQPSTRTITYGDSVTQYCSCTNSDYHAECSLWRDATNATAANNTAVTLAAGTYNYKSNMTASQNYTGATSPVSVIIVRKEGISISLAPATQAITYPATALQYCVGNHSTYLCTLWRDEVNVTTANNTSPALGAGAYDYKANVSANAANYSWTAQTSTLTVNKAASATNALINGTDGNQNIENATGINVSCSVDVTGGHVNMYTNLTGWVNQTGLSPIENSSNIVYETVGNVFILRCWYNTTANYTASEETHQITISRSWLVDSETYPSDGFQNQPRTFTLNITNTSATVYDIEATLTFNNTQYDITPTEGSGWWLFSSEQLMPMIESSDNGTIPFQWNYSVYDDGSRYTGTQSAKSVVVYRMRIEPCLANVTLTQSKRLVFLNESNGRESINATIDGYLNFTLYSVDYSYNFTAVNETVWLCVFPAWGNATSGGHFQYVNESDNYRFRDYWLDVDRFDNVTEDLDMYLISVGGSTRVDILVNDEYTSPYPDVVVEVQRWFPELNSYVTIAKPKTDDQGGTNTYLVLYDAYYRFVLRKDGTILTTIPRRIVRTTELTFTIDPGELIQWLQFKIKGGCHPDSAAGTLACTYTGPSEYITDVTLDVWHLGALYKSHVCSSTNTSATGSLVCTIGNATNKIYTYTLIANLTTAANDVYMIAQGILNEGSLDTKIFGNCGSAYNLLACREGIVIVFFLTLMSSLVAIYHPQMSIVFMLVSVSVSWFMGLLAITMTSVIGLIFVGAVIVYKMT